MRKRIRLVVAFSTPESGDVAQMYDLAGSKDTMKAWPEDARLYGKGFYNRAVSFDQVHGFGTPGDGDVALLYDDAATADTFKAWPTDARFYGNDFYNRAGSFDTVMGFATQGGGDVSHLYDSAGNDEFYATPESAKLFGEGFYNRVDSFSQVYANSEARAGEHDHAHLFDSAMEEYPDHLEAEANWARLSNDLLGYAYQALEFEEVDVELSNDSDQNDANPDPSAVDFILNLNPED